MIKIVRGVYGFVDKYGIVRPKTVADEPFELPAEQEARLVRLGVAEYVGIAEDEQDPIGFDETPPEDFGGEDESEAEAEEEITDLESLTGKELRELGQEYGLAFGAKVKKADMIAAITEAQKKAAESESEDEDNEPAPVFDATEAVQ